MELILLERVAKLGGVGDVVSVRNGYARNFLLPQGKALRANASNKKFFEERRVEFLAKSQEVLELAKVRAESVAGKTIVLIRPASESGQLYGSVRARDIAEACSTQLGVDLAAGQVAMSEPIKSLGIFTQSLSLHAEIEAQISVNVAVNEAAAQRQAEAHESATKTKEDSAQTSDPSPEPEAKEQTSDSTTRIC